jgi:hypothetical protein
VTETRPDVEDVVMIEAQATGTDAWIVRLGAWAGVVGSLLAMVGNLLHPATPTGDPEAWPARSPTAAAGCPCT